MQHTDTPVEQRIEQFMARKMEQFPELRNKRVSKRVSEADVVRGREKFFSSLVGAFSFKHSVVSAK